VKLTFLQRNALGIYADSYLYNTDYNRALCARHGLSFWHEMIVFAFCAGGTQ